MDEYVKWTYYSMNIVPTMFSTIIQTLCNWSIAASTDEHGSSHVIIHCHHSTKYKETDANERLRVLMQIAATKRWYESVESNEQLQTKLCVRWAN